jgi:hypothetical protein
MRGEQRWIVAEDGGTLECAVSSDGLSQRMGARANARQTGTDCCIGWGHARMRSEQRRIVAEDGGTRECAANRGNALARLMVTAQKNDNPIEDG